MMKDIKQDRVTKIKCSERLTFKGGIDYYSSEERINSAKKYLGFKIGEKLIEDGIVTFKVERDFEGAKITAQLEMGNPDYVYELEKEIWKLENSSMKEVIETVHQAEWVAKKYRHIEEFANEISKATEKFEKAMNETE